MKTITYKGDLIAKGSEAYDLWELIGIKGTKALDEHMKEVHRKAVERGEIRERKPITGKVDLEPVVKSDFVAAFGPALRVPNT